MEELDFEVDIPTPDHIEMVFKGALDTINGSESFTPAQTYLAGAMYSSRLIRFSQVTGNEGFFSKIGEGAKAVIDYIKRMFKAIWNFFTGGGKSEIEKTNKLLTNLEAKVDALDKPFDKEMTDKILEKAERQLNKLSEASKADTERLKKRLDEIKTFDDKVDARKKEEAARALVTELFTANAADREFLKDKRTDITERVKNLRDISDSVEYRKEISELETSLGDIHKKMSHAHTLTDAKAWIKLARENIRKMETILEKVDKDKDSFGEKIKELEKDPTAAGNAEKIEELKKAVAGGSEVVKVSKDITNLVNLCAQRLEKAIVVII